MDNRALPPRWQEALVALIKRYSTSPHFKPYATAQELAARGLFVEQGRMKTAPDPMTQSIDDYIDSFHARASLSRTRMGTAAEEFDTALRDVIAKAGVSEVVVERVTEIVWGIPA